MEKVGLNNKSSSFVGKPQGRVAPLFFVAFVPMGAFYVLRELRVSQVVSGTAAITIAAISGIALYPKKEPASPPPKDDPTLKGKLTPPPTSPRDEPVGELPPLGPELLASMVDPEKTEALSESYRVAVLERIEEAVKGQTVNRRTLQQILREIETNCSNLPVEKEQESWRRVKQSIEVILGEIDALALERQVTRDRLRSAGQAAGTLLDQGQEMMITPGLTLETIGQFENQVTRLTTQPIDLPADNMTASIRAGEGQYLEACRQLTTVIEMLKMDYYSSREVDAAQVAQEKDRAYCQDLEAIYNLGYWRVQDDGDCLFHAASGALGQPTDPKGLRKAIATRIRQLFASEESPFRTWVEHRINDFIQETVASESKPRGCPQAYYDLLQSGQAGGWEGYCTYLEKGQGELPTLLFGGEVEAAFLAEIFNRPIVIHHRLQPQVYLPNHEPSGVDYDAISALPNPLHLFHAGGVHYNYFTVQTSAAASSS